MRCLLCLQEKELLKKSHIASKFLYKELKGKDASFSYIKYSNKKNRKTQTGPFEKDILCYECDNELLSGYEDYAYKVLYTADLNKDIKLEQKNTLDGVRYISCEGINYKKFKLFLLSLLWRFSISKHDFYQSVDLGIHQEIIRKMIIEGNPGDVLDYPCTIETYRAYKDLPVEIITSPRKERSANGCICYRVIMCGVVYTFYISKEKVPKHISELAINQHNRLIVLYLSRDFAKLLLKKDGII